MTRFLFDTGSAGDYIQRRCGVYERAREAVTMWFVSLLPAKWPRAVYGVPRSGTDVFEGAVMTLAWQGDAIAASVARTPNGAPDHITCKTSSQRSQSPADVPHQPTTRRSGWRGC